MSIVVTPIPITSLSHSQLTGVTTSQHHAQYTEAEAEAVADTQIAIHAALATVHQTIPSDALTKCWGVVGYDGTLSTPSYNITSSGRDADPGQYNIVWATDFGSQTYNVNVDCYGGSGNSETAQLLSSEVGGIDVFTFRNGSLFNDGWTFSAIGQQ